LSDSGLSGKIYVTCSYVDYVCVKKLLRKMDTSKLSGESETEWHKNSETELKEARVVKPEIVAKWRQWGVPEQVIANVVFQRHRVKTTREMEERIMIPDFVYKMPRLPEIEANAWGFAKAIDSEGTIQPKGIVRTGKIARIDTVAWRRKYYQPRVIISTRDYEPIEEIADMMHVSVRILHTHVRVINHFIIMYRAESAEARAVRICHLVQPHLKILEKKRRAMQILEIYKQAPLIKIR